MEKPYKPISCDFHSELTSRATLRRRAEIVYKENGDEKAVIDYIEDVYTKGDEEFARLRDGITLRLDQIIRVDDAER